MTQAQNATREPTMEEILASIRRIIEDGNPPLTAEPEPESEEVREFRREFGEEAIADSLQHAGAMTALGQRIGAKNMAPIIDAAFYRDEADVADMAAKAPADEPERTGILEEEPALAADFAGGIEQDNGHMESLERIDPQIDENAAVAEEPAQSSLERHLRPILSDMTGRQVAAAFGDLSQAIEKERQMSLAQMAEDMIRPMLQEWLDNNLPTMVERLVREEIERVSRSGRR